MRMNNTNIKSIKYNINQGIYKRTIELYLMISVSEVSDVCYGTFFTAHQGFV